VRQLAALCLLLAAACGGGSTDDRTLTVFAASSLTGALTEQAQLFERDHPGLTVRLSFAGSQSLVAQLEQGGPADVLATADTASMAATGLVASRVFARNALAVVTAPGNPLRVRTLADLAQPGLRVVLAGPTVPAGRASTKALAAAGVRVRPVSLEQDVKGVVTKVRLGEADAGIAYVTDVTSADGAVDGTALPGVSNELPVAVVRRGTDAQQFADFLLSSRGQQVLRTYGFLPPP
jgi:molybdate transport system substrate-binding protein